MKILKMLLMNFMEKKNENENRYRVQDSTSLRRATLINKVPYCTNMSTAYACLEGIKSLKSKKINVKAIQEI